MLLHIHTYARTHPKIVILQEKLDNWKRRYTILGNFFLRRLFATAVGIVRVYVSV